MEATKNNKMVNSQQLEQSFDNIKNAVQGEHEDEMFYDYLISEAPTSEEKEIISSIRDDERRHNVLFRRIYEDFTKEKIPEATEEETFEKPESYLAGIKKALFGELKAVERYRVIRRSLPEGPYRDILFDIITDELKHASKYNYLFTLNNNNNVETTGDNIPEMNGGGNTQTTNGGSNNVQSTSGSSNNVKPGSTSINEGTSANTSTEHQNTANFTPDDWVKYITPLVNRALAEAKEGINPEHLYQEFILSGVLVGLGKKPQEAIDQVEEWEKTGTSKLLAMSKMSRYFEY